MVKTFTCPQCNRLTCTCNNMDDQAEQYASYDGLTGSRNIEHNDPMANECLHWRRIATRLLGLLNTGDVSIDAHQTDNAPLAEWGPSENGKQYDVRIGKKGMGS